MRKMILAAMCLGFFSCATSTPEPRVQLFFGGQIHGEYVVHDLGDDAPDLICAIASGFGFEDIGVGETYCLCMLGGYVVHHAGTLMVPVFFSPDPGVCTSSEE